MHGRSLQTAAAFSIAFVFAAYAGAALGPVYGGHVTVSIGEMPSRFDPVPARGAGARLISALVHERLVEARDGAPRPALAESWTSSADGREWTIRLRPDSVFHDGAAITAADAVRSLRRFLRSPSASAAGWAARVDGGEAYRRRATDEVAGLTASDPSTISIRLSRPSGASLLLLSAADAAITSARGAGAGPFVATSASPIGGGLAAVAFPAHVRGRPFLDTVEVRADPASPAPGPDLAPAIGRGPLAATLLLVLDPTHPAFTRADIRRTVDASIDRRDLVRHFVPGGAIARSAIPQLLLPSPRQGGAVPLRRGLATGAIVLAVSRDVPALISQRVVACLGAVGLQATAVQMSPDNVWTVRAAARLVAWVPEVPDRLLAMEELALLAPWRGSDGVARAAAEPDADRRAALLDRAETALRAEATILPLAAAPVGFRSRAGLHAIAVDDGGRIRLENAWVMP